MLYDIKKSIGRSRSCCLKWLMVVPLLNCWIVEFYFCWFVLIQRAHTLCVMFYDIESPVAKPLSTTSVAGWVLIVLDARRVSICWCCWIASLFGECNPTMQTQTQHGPHLQHTQTHNFKSLVQSSININNMCLVHSSHSPSRSVITVKK